MLLSSSGETTRQSEFSLFYKKDTNLQDIVISPARDFAIVITKTEMKFYALQDTGPGELLLGLAVHDVIVAQWATGKHVPDWTVQLQKIANEQLAEPMIRITPGSN